MKETNKYLNRDLIWIRKVIHLQITETSQSYSLNKYVLLHEIWRWLFQDRYSGCIMSSRPRYLLAFCFSRSSGFRMGLPNLKVTSWSKMPMRLSVREEEGGWGGKRACFPAKSVSLKNTVMESPPNNCHLHTSYQGSWECYLWAGYMAHRIKWRFC